MSGAGGMDLCHQCLLDSGGGCIFTARLHEACIWQTRHLLSPEKHPHNVPPAALHWSWHCFRNSKAASSQPPPDTRHEYLVCYTFFFLIWPRHRRGHCRRAPLWRFRLQTIESSSCNMRSPPRVPVEAMSLWPAPTSQVLLCAGAGHALPWHAEGRPQGSVPLLVQVRQVLQVGRAGGCTRKQRTPSHPALRSHLPHSFFL